MDFSEALSALLEGHKVNRSGFAKDIKYIAFNNDEKELRYYWISAKSYPIDGELLSSKDWVLQGKEAEHSFAEMLKGLQEGRMASRLSWDDDKWLEYDATGREIVLRKYENLPMQLMWEDCAKQDWYIVD